SIIEKKPKHLALAVEALDADSINKLIVACYINPADSFKITLGKGIDYDTVLEQKRLLAVELVEIEGNTITCESSISINDPDLLLKTMVSKMKNLVQMMQKHHSPELVQRYEEEIDRNRLLIDKAVIGFLTYNRPGKLRPIELHYLALIAKDLERLTDHLILLDLRERNFLAALLPLLSLLKESIDRLTDQQQKFSHRDALAFVRAVHRLRDEPVRDIQSYYRGRVKHYLSNVSEVLLDWAITDQLEGGK
ncbi:MAG TPA: hypothetical protein VJK52_05720, partial [Candidatus Nanoarchaeia archaeon]|nr:hypothetical protein [Candidatus Nanoarchaeia archaeon]